MTRYGFDLNETVTFIPETRHLSIEQFKPRDPHKVDKDWKLWLEEIEREFRYFRIETRVKYRIRDCSSLRSILGEIWFAQIFVIVRNM